MTAPKKSGVKFVAFGSKLVYLAIVLGGTAAPYARRVWGAVTFWSRSLITRFRPALRDRTNSAVPNLVVGGVALGGKR